MTRWWSSRTSKSTRCASTTCCRFTEGAHRPTCRRQDRRVEQVGAVGGHVRARLQVQERLTTQIAGALQDALQPAGVAVVMEAHHFCMMMRGVEKQNSQAITSCMLGAFRDSRMTREEFLQLIHSHRTP